MQTQRRDPRSRVKDMAVQEMHDYLHQRYSVGGVERGSRLRRPGRRRPGLLPRHLRRRLSRPQSDRTTCSQLVMQSIASFDPDLTLVAGDLAYASDGGTFACGHVIIIGLNDSDVSALGTADNGCTGSQPTGWLVEQLTRYRDQR